MARFGKKPRHMPKRAYELSLARASWEEFVTNVGGDEEVLYRLRSHVLDGGGLLELANDYWGVDYGMMWLWLSDPKYPERLRGYYDAQRGLAEASVSQVIGIADGGVDEEGNPVGDVARDKLRIETRLRTAKHWAKERYGEDEGKLVGGLENLAVVLERISLRKKGELISAGGEVEDAQLVPAERVGYSGQGSGQGKEGSA